MAFQVTNPASLQPVEVQNTEDAPIPVAIISGGGGGGGGGGTEYTEDAASASNPAGPMSMARRRDALTGSEVSADGDNIALNATSKGELHVKHADAIPVTDNGGSLTVDGPLTDAQLRATEVPVSLASVPSHAVTNAGTFAVQATDAGANWSQSRKLVSSSDASGADVDGSDAPTSGQKVVVDDVLVSVDTAMRVDFKEETSGTVIFSMYLPASGTAQFTPRGKMKLDTANKKLLVRTSAAGNIRATVLWHSEA